MKLLDHSSEHVGDWFQLLVPGDPKELFTFGSSEGVLGQQYPNKWPSEGKNKREAYYIILISYFVYVYLIYLMDIIRCFAAMEANHGTLL